MFGYKIIDIPKWLEFWLNITDREWKNKLISMLSLINKIMWSSVT